MPTMQAKERREASPLGQRDQPLLFRIHRTIRSIDEERGLAVERSGEIRRRYIPVFNIRLVREARIQTTELRFKSPDDVAQILYPYYVGLDREHMLALLLNQKNALKGIHVVYIGSVHTTVVRLCELFQVAVLRNATGLIVAHNHPSGDPTPSPEDAALTREIVKAGRLLDIDVMDHIVIGDRKFVSLKERGLGFDR